MKLRRPVALLALTLAGTSALLVACLDDDCSDDKCVEPSEGTGEDAGNEDAASPEEAGRDGGTANQADAADAALDARKPLDRDANGPGAADDPCSFNHDCQLSLRCECAGFDCTCQPGARGTGVPGAVCTVGEDCVSSLCVDGPAADMLCSDACEVDLNCPESLPICSAIAGIGKICVRTPPK